MPYLSDSKEALHVAEWAKVVRRTLANRRFRPVLTSLFSITIFVFALWVLHRTAGRFDTSDVLSTVGAYPGNVLVFAFLLALASYAALGGFDWLGLRHVDRRVPFGWTMLISFVSHAVSHNAGFAVLSGGSIRLRMYSVFGLKVAEVGGVVAFAGLTFGLGVATLSSIAFIMEGERVAPLLRLPAGAIIGIGWLGAGILACYFVWSALARRPLAIGLWRFATPSLPLAAAQIVVACTDLALVAGALYVLLPMEATGLSFAAFIGLYVVATIAGTISHVPGGLGVFEGALLLLLPNAVPEAVLAALLIFRVFYNLLPLLLAALVLVVFELLQRFHHRPQARWAENLGPALSAVLVFVCGGMAVLSGAVAGDVGFSPGIAETAHALSAVSGAILLLLPGQLIHRDSRAFRLTLAFLAATALLVLLRGPDWIAAGMLFSGLALLAGTGALFNRPSQLPQQPPSMGWIGASAAVIGVGMWLTWHGAPHIPDIWSFTSRETGTRAMRGMIMAGIVLIAASLVGAHHWYRRNA